MGDGDGDVYSVLTLIPEGIFNHGGWSVEGLKCANRGKERNVEAEFFWLPHIQCYTSDCLMSVV